MNELAIQKVQNYIDNVLIEPKHCWQKQLLLEWSYSRWAAIEILHALMDRSYESPEVVVQDFATKMAMFSYIKPKSKKSLRFIIALDVAEEILNFYI